MSYLARLKQQISSDAPQREATKGTKAPFDTFVAPHPAPLRDILPINADPWQYFEQLLAIVGPAYQTPAHEYALLRELARKDLPAATTCYRIMAAQIVAAM